MIGGPTKYYSEIECVKDFGHVIYTNCNDEHDIMSH